MDFLCPQSEIRTQRPAFHAILALAAVLILSLPGFGSEARTVDAVSIFNCSFADEWDVNYDRWPDRWTRSTGAEFPHYVGIEIADDDTAANGRCLRMNLDGAAAAVSSPPIRVMSRFSYMLDAQVKNEGLKHSTVVVTLEFCDSNGRVLQTLKSDPISNTRDWKSVRLGPIEPNTAAIDRAVIGLQVIKQAKGDLRGQVSLSGITLSRLPRIDVSTNNPCNVYKSTKDVVVRCELSGIREKNPEIHFQLFDAFNNELQSESVPLDGKLIVGKSSTAPATEGRGGPAGYEGKAEWRPHVPDFGVYRVVVKMLSAPGSDHGLDADRQLGNRTIDLVVVPPLPMPRNGEFGWTLPNADKPLSFQELSRLLPEIGINWVKVPVWFDASDPHRGDELIRFVELLGASNIDVVGIIDRPPARTELASKLGRDASTAEVLAQDASTWSPSLEPVMTRLALRVRWWQLGQDNDTSIAGLPDLNKRMAEMRGAMFRFGQDVHMGMSWDWDAATAYSGKVDWEFQQLRASARPTTEDLERLLQNRPNNSALQWVTIEPPQRADISQHISIKHLLPFSAATASFAAELAPSTSLLMERSAALLGPAIRDQRASDFVLQLVTAKVHGADGIIIAEPFNDSNGLMRANGMPAELLLPWRTTAAMLGGAKYLGQMQLPCGSENRIFLRADGQVVMVVWNPSVTRETLFLGHDIHSIDIFGRTSSAIQSGNEQSIDVGPAPTFILGLNEAITRIRMSTRFEKNKLASIFSKPQRNSLNFKNYFPQGVGGSVRIVVLDGRSSEARSTTAGGQGLPVFSPESWTIEPQQATFQLAPNEEKNFAFDIKLKNALFGQQPVRVDFKIEADERYQFSVYHAMEVGTEDITLEVRSHLDKDGTLVVEQLMTNSADRLADFKCYLRARGYRPQRMQVFRLGKNLDRRVYRYPNGRTLVGKEMLLELEELNGPRVLRYRFVATAELPQSKKPATNADGSPADPANENGSRSPLARIGS